MDLDASPPRAKVAASSPQTVGGCGLLSHHQKVATNNQQSSIHTTTKPILFTHIQDGLHNRLRTLLPSPNLYPASLTRRETDRRHSPNNFPLLPLPPHPRTQPPIPIRPAAPTIVGFAQHLRALAPGTAFHRPLHRSRPDRTPQVPLEHRARGRREEDPAF